MMTVIVCDLIVRGVCGDVDCFCFFFKQKTAYEMRISDWSSDVCSSDLLQRLNATVDWLDAGCCGMAGSFGFRASSYELSQTIAEQSLLPAVRAAEDRKSVV